MLGDRDYYKNKKRQKITKKKISSFTVISLIKAYWLALVLPILRFIGFKKKDSNKKLIKKKYGDKKLNYILLKINKNGLKSLNDNEKKYLQKTSNKLNNLDSQ